MHTADMPLSTDSSTKIGLGLWRHRDLSLAAEMIALWSGALIWLRSPGQGGRHRATALIFLGVLTVVLLSTPFTPPPSGPAAFAITALVSYVVFAAVAAWVDRRLARPISGRPAPAAAASTPARTG
jgi:hypothetical protein